MLANISGGYTGTEIYSDCDYVFNVRAAVSPRPLALRSPGRSPGTAGAGSRRRRRPIRSAPRSPRTGAACMLCTGPPPASRCGSSACVTCVRAPAARAHVLPAERHPAGPERRCARPDELAAPVRVLPRERVRPARVLQPAADDHQYRRVRRVARARVQHDGLLRRVHRGRRHCEQLQQRVLGDRIREDVHRAGEHERIGVGHRERL
jgi:hypothetical protein